MDSITRRISAIVLTIFLLAAALGVTAGLAFGQDVELRHYVAQVDTVTTPMGQVGVQDHLMVGAEGRAAKVIVVRLLADLNQASIGAASGQVSARRQEGDVGVLCFKVDEVEGDVPPEVVGFTYCYLYDPANDTFVPVTSQGELGATMNNCGEDHTLSVPDPNLRGT